MRTELLRRTEEARELRRRALEKVEQLIGATETSLSLLAAVADRRSVNGASSHAAERALREAKARLDRLYEQRERLLARQAEDGERRPP